MRFCRHSKVYLFYNNSFYVYWSTAVFAARCKRQTKSRYYPDCSPALARLPTRNKYVVPSAWSGDCSRLCSPSLSIFGRYCSQRQGSAPARMCGCTTARMCGCTTARMCGCTTARMCGCTTAVSTDCCREAG